jgi:anti-sigma factor RsiW
MPACDRERERISLAVDGELSDFEGFLMAVHLDGCAECRAYSDDVRAIAESIRSTPAEPLRVPVAARLRDARLRARPRLRLAPAASAAAAIAAALVGVTSVPERAVVDDGAHLSAPALRGSDGSLVNELVLAVRRPHLADGTQAVLPQVPGGLGAVKPPLLAIPS